MRGVARGDHAALAAIYDRYAGPVFAVCRRMLGDSLAAEELLGDVFCELWRRADRFDGERGTVLALLLTLTRSRGIDRLRAAKAWGGRVPLVADDEEGAEPAVADSPLTRLADAEQRQRVVAALDALGPDQRRAIELAYYDGLSHSEVAQRLERPLGTVKTWIRQGLIRLRESLRIGSGGAP